MSDTQNNKESQEPTMEDVERLKRVLANPTTRAALTAEDHNDTKRPVKWKRRSTASYYRERFALEFRDVLDGMIADPKKEDVVYLYSVYCSPSYGMNKDTLYARVYHSMRYLVDNLDPEGKYAEALSTIELHRQRDVGIRLSFMKDIKLGKPFAPIAVSRKDNNKVWEDELTAWLIAPDHKIGDRYVNTKLALTSEEIEELQVKLNSHSGFTSVVTETSVKVMCIPREDEE